METAIQITAGEAKKMYFESQRLIRETIVKGKK